MPIGDKRVGLHYIVFSKTAVANTALARAGSLKIAEIDDAVTNLG
jgi:hypothetical protein